MDLNDIAIDPVRVEQGAWIDTGLGDIRVRIRGVHNSDWAALFSKLDSKISLSKRKNKIEYDKEVAAATNECIVQAGLIDWDGLTENKEPLPFSTDNARRLIFDPKFKAFRDVCVNAAVRVAHESDVALADAIKN